jgi:hypothetical protein
MNLTQLVTSSDENDLRLAAHLFFSDELDAESERLFVERLSEPAVAQCLADAVGLQALGTLASDSVVSDSVVEPSVRFFSTPYAVGAWSMVAMTIAIAFGGIWYFRESARNESERTQRVAELWVSQLVHQTGLDSFRGVEPVEDFDSNVDSSLGSLADSASTSDSQADGELGLAPPSWLLAAAMLSVDSGTTDGAEGKVEVLP